VAILLVMLMHTGLVANGFLGVDVFFALSGFLITSLLYEEWDRTGAVSFRRFYERRARRLLPGLLVLVGAFAVIYVALHPFTGWPLGPRALTTLLFVNNWVAGLGHSQGLGALNPTWSLATEDQFYLVWPLVLVTMLRRQAPPALVLGVLAVAAVALVAAVPTIERADPAYSLYYSPLDRFAELLIGCAAAVAWRHRLVPRALGWRLTGPVLVLALYLLLRAQLMPVVWLYMGSVTVAAALIVHLLERERGILARLLAAQPLGYVGRISYGLYLFNLLVNNLLLHYASGLSLHLHAALTFAITFPLAAASWRWLESRVLAGGARPSRAPRLAPRRTRLEPAR
jgi:peptidoglycan/LPS O-acetylase OafA/YrhL